MPSRAHRCISRLRDWWPDTLVGALLAIGSTVMLVNRDGAERLSLGQVLPGPSSDVYLACLLATALGLIASIIRRRAVDASRSAAVASLLLALQGAMVVGSHGTASIMASVAYLGFSLLVLNRAIVLARGVLVPVWLIPASERPPVPPRRRRSPRAEGR